MTFLRRSRVVATRLACLGLFPFCAFAQAPARFDIALEAPEPLAGFLLQHVELQRYRSLSDLDGRELGRLLNAAPENLRQLLGTQGHFSPHIQIDHDIDEATATDGRPLGTVRIRIDPGPVTTVASAQVFFTGDIAHHEAGAAQREAITRSSRAAVGRRFSQAAWSQTKSEALRLLTSERYPRARLVNSLSDIDSTTSVARWYLELDSGPVVRVGPVRVEGHERYDTQTVANLVALAGLRPGADYSLARLQDAQQQIADTGYYTSVFAYADLEPTEDDPLAPAPVVVQVREAPLQSLVLGAGGSTNNGPRLSAEHKHLRLPVLGWQALSKLQLERHDQLLSSDWRAPVEPDGWHWLAGARLARQIDDDLTLSSLRLSLGRAQASPRLDRRYFLQYDRARTVNTLAPRALQPGNEAALSANYGWTWRRFDTLPYPNRGFGLGLTLGVGSTLGTVRQPFVSAQARWLGYWSLDPVSQVLGDLRDALISPRPTPEATDRTGRLGRLALRLQGGALLADTQAPIPDSQLFLTGGDNTVRGYGLRDIGVEQPDGTVRAGRYLAVASVEWQRPMWRAGERTPWETVLFADVGTVTNQTTEVDLRVGAGAGLRYNSPVGPLQLDLAYGLKPQRWRVHLNIGFSF